MLALASSGARRLARLSLIVCAFNGAPTSPALAQAVGIEQPRSTAPLPPRRPVELGGAPPVEQGSPATTSPTKLPADTTPDATPDLPTGLTQRLEPPPYDRGAMRICGEEWQALKRAGRTSGKVWRDFAAECLTREIRK